MFGKFLIIGFILLVGLCNQADAQMYDRGLFGTSTLWIEDDTLAVSADSLETKTFTWAWRSVRGSSLVYGKMWVLTGKVRTITVKFTPYYPDGTLSGTMRTLGTVTVTDSVKYEYQLANEDWWGICAGGKVSFVPD